MARRLEFREPEPNDVWTILIHIRPKRHKRCVVCGRENTRGFSRLKTSRVRFENGRTTELPATPTWVCRPGYGCEGVGPIRVAFGQEL
jgi:hypothetical protein